MFSLTSLFNPSKFKSRALSFSVVIIIFGGSIIAKVSLITAMSLVLKEWWSGNINVFIRDVSAYKPISTSNCRGKAIPVSNNIFLLFISANKISFSFATSLNTGIRLQYSNVVKNSSWKGYRFIVLLNTR